jgi:transcriptional regulator with XRE-family HTH domain
MATGLTKLVSVLRSGTGNRGKIKPEIHPIDIHVGQRLRDRRKYLEITQEQLANSIGSSFQQIHKYESGANRVSASKLWKIAVALRTPVTYFFEDAAVAPERSPAGARKGGAEGSSPPTTEAEAFLKTAEGVDLAMSFSKISHAKIRRKVLDLVRAMADDPKVPKPSAPEG